MKLSKKAWAKMSIALLHIGITDATALVCMIIVHHTQGGSEAIATDYIADTVGHCKRTVLRSIRILEAADLITVQRRPGLPSLYALTDRCRELCASALKPTTEQRTPQYQSRRTKRPLTQAEIDDLNEYLELSDYS